MHCHNIHLALGIFLTMTSNILAMQPYVKPARLLALHKVCAGLTSGPAQPTKKWFNAQLIGLEGAITVREFLEGPQKGLITGHLYLGRDPIRQALKFQSEELPLSEAKAYYEKMALVFEEEQGEWRYKQLMEYISIKIPRK